MASPRIERPVMRYHGGKFGARGHLADWIIGHLPTHRIYVEPYGGGASVLIRKPRSYAEVYNDLAGDVVNVFRVLRDQPGELERRLRLTPFARAEFEASYDAADEPVERARRTIFRSCAGFGSAAATKGYKTGFRANSNRSGTTPAQDWRSYPDHVAAFAERLQGVVIEQREALEVMQAHDRPDALHFVDPPYLHSTRRPGNPYDRVYEHDMTDAEHEALADCLQSLDGMVVLCGYPSPMYDELFPGWRRIERQAFADGARPRTECLWLNQVAQEARAQSCNDLFQGEAS